MKWTRYPNVAVRSPCLTLALWLLFAAAMAIIIFLRPQTSLDTTFHSLLMADDPDRPFNDAQKQVFGEDEHVLIAVENEAGIFNPETLKQIDDLSRALLRLEGVRDVYSLTHIADIRSSGAGALNSLDLVTEVPQTVEQATLVERDAALNPIYQRNLVSDDKKVAGINVELATSAANRELRGSVLREIKKLVDAEAGRGPGRLYLTGAPYASALSGAALNQDIAIPVGLCCLVLIVMLGIVFKNWHGIVFCLLLALVGVAAVVGLLTFAGITISLFLTVGVIFAAALAIKYALDVGYAYLEYSYDELGLGHEIRDCRLFLSESLWNVRLSVILSAAAAIVVFLIISANPVPDVSHLGLALAAGTFVASFGALSIVPAVISLHPFSVSREHVPNPLATWLVSHVRDLVVARPKVFLAIMAGILVLAAAGWSRLSFDTDAMDYFGKRSEIAVSEQVVRARLGGTTHLPFVVTGNAADYFKDPANLKKLEAIQRHAEKLPHVTKTISYADHLKLMNRAMHDEMQQEYVLPADKQLVEQYLALHGNPQDFRTVVDTAYRQANIELHIDTMSTQALLAIEADLEAFTKEHFSELNGNLLGTTLLVARSFDKLTTAMLWGLALAIVAIWLVLWIVMGTFRFGTLAFVSVLAPVVIVFGILGWSGCPLDPFMAATGCFALVISANDTLHFCRKWKIKLRRVAEDKTAALLQAFNENGRSIVLSNLALALVFGALGASLQGALMWYGGVLCATMLIVLVCDLVLIPALIPFSRYHFPIPSGAFLSSVFSWGGDLQNPKLEPGKYSFKYFTDEQVARLKSYDLFALAGKTVLRHGWLGGTRRLLHEMELKPGMRLLDLGCGEGAQSVCMAKEFGIEVWGIDLSEVYCTEARRNSEKSGVADQCHFTVGDVTLLPFADDFFDAILMEGLAMYVNMAQLFKECLRVLSPGGVVGLHDWSWSKLPSKELDGVNAIIACGCRPGSIQFYDTEGWRNQLVYNHYNVKYVYSYPFVFFSTKLVFDDEGLWGGLRLFGRVMSRWSVTKHFGAIAFFLRKYEPWLTYTIAVGEKPLDFKASEVENLEPPTCSVP